MKYWLMLLLAVMIHRAGQAQEKNREHIKISADLELVRLTPNAWLHVSYAEIAGFGRVASNGVIFSNGREAFLFDTPATDAQTKELVTWLKDSLKLKITGFVPNHWHSDCMGGLGYLQAQGIPSYAGQKTIEVARENHLPVPGHSFRDSLQLSLGGLPIDCYYLGAAHSLDNIVVWLPTEQILFAGCMVKSMNAKDLGNTADGDLVAYPKTIDNLRQKFPAAKIVVPGHGDPGGPELIEHTRALLTK